MQTSLTSLRLLSTGIGQMEDTLRREEVKFINNDIPIQTPVAINVAQERWNKATGRSRGGLISTKKKETGSNKRYRVYRWQISVDGL